MTTDSPMKLDSQAIEHWNGRMSDVQKIEVLREALEMCRGRWADLAEIIREDGPYGNAGFCAATARRCEAALTATKPL